MPCVRHGVAPITWVASAAGHPRVPCVVIRDLGQHAAPVVRLVGAEEGRQEQQQDAQPHGCVGCVGTVHGTTHC